MSTIDTNTTVGQLVADRPARSRLFEKLGIDYCCGGKLPLAEVCRKKGLDAATVLAMLQATEAADEAKAGEQADPQAMTLAELTRHIEQTHHQYLKDELPRLHAMVQKVAAVHGDHHPWMREVREVFDELAQEMFSHMAKEEQVLFPIIRAMEAGEHGAASHCGSVANPIRMMEWEHDQAGEHLARLNELSSGYTPPQGACNTFRAMLDGLDYLEKDMHQHVHKENNVLFPRTLALQTA